MAAQRVQLSGARETLLATLYGRALDARGADPILGDRLADEITRRLDYDFGKLKVTSSDAMGVAVRAKYVDKMAAQALGDVSDPVLLHLGCGLDTRAFRLDPEARLEWYEVDFPEVIELRRAVVPDRPRSHPVASSVTDLGWLDQVPAGRPVVVVAEGLMQYLRKEEFVRLFRSLVERFPTGQLVLDSWNSFAARFGKYQRSIRATGATTGGWGIDDPSVLERWIPGLRLVAAHGYWDLPELARAPAPTRAAVAVMRHVRVLRDVGLILRYAF
jgi:O-methyltransferase involved in polyketide biosynthesis